MNKNEFQAFETSDFYLSCYLYSQGVDFTGVRPSGNDSRRQIFMFNVEVDKVQELQQSYYDGSGLVSMKKLKHAICDLKGIIYQNTK